MKFKKILVVYKKPLLDIYKERSKNNCELRDIIREEGKNIKGLEREQKEDRLTRKVLESVFKKQRSLKVDWIYRAKLSEHIVRKYDLVISFGGDGTLIDASHFIGKEGPPIFGVNSDYTSDLESSEGFFLAANKVNFDEKYNALQDGKLIELKFPRLRAVLNGTKLKELVLNDIKLVDGDHGTSRMIIKDKSVEEFQKNDFLIIATPSSTWAIGHNSPILPVTEKKVIYTSVGLYLGRLNFSPLLKRGATERLEVYSRMRKGIMLLDGKHVRYSFGLGSKLEVYVSREHLKIIGFNEQNRDKYYTKRFISEEDLDSYLTSI